jgi:GNAT superfamily N-acetyltransferase
MTDPVEIARVYSLPAGLEILRREAARQGFGFLDRLVSDWTSGANTFGRPGEVLLGAFADSRLVGIGGLNADPYSSRTDLGRVRHVYVLDAWRQQGVGRALIDCLVRTARESFTELRLRTATEGAAAFYVRCGFSPIDDPAASHALNLVEPG